MATAIFDSLRADFGLGEIKSEVQSKQIPPLSTDEHRFHDTNVEEWVVQAGLGNFKRKQAGIFQKYVEQKMGLLQIASSAATAKIAVHRIIYVTL